MFNLELLFQNLYLLIQNLCILVLIEAMLRLKLLNFVFSQLHLHLVSRELRIESFIGLIGLAELILESLELTLVVLLLAD